MMKSVIIGNWKMAVGLEESKELALKLRDWVSFDVEITVCPSLSAATSVASILRDTPIHLGAQDVFWEERGAYTGEESILTLKEIGCTHVIIGHSERRQFSGETEKMINRKLKTVIEKNLTPILCVGETLSEYRRGKSDPVVQKQLHDAFLGITAADQLMVAYEPVWAIGNEHACDPKEANERCVGIRCTLRNFLDDAAVDRARILYGGSVDETNVQAYVSQPGIDGVLVGGASVKPEIFSKMTKLIAEQKTV